MPKKELREIAKFVSGLIAADFLCGLWFYFSPSMPATILGYTFTPQQIVFWLLFDVVLFAFLVHYAWAMKSRRRTDGERVFHNVVGTVFALVALLHLSRILFGWEFVIGSWSVPYWLNGLGTAATAFLSYLSFHLGSGSAKK